MDEWVAGFFAHREDKSFLFKDQHLVGFWKGDNDGKQGAEG